MKRIVLLLGMSMLSLITVVAQNVGINANGWTPDASAGLDVNFTDKGLLIPRMDIDNLTTADPISATPVTSLLVYNTNTTTGPGYFYWDGSKWSKLFDINDGEYWKLTGNAGTVDGTNFLGTTDNIPLSFRINNQKAGRIATDNTFYGYLSGNSITSGNNNVFNGDYAGYNITTGSENIFVGHRVGYYMQTGSSNTAIGYNALYNYGGSGSGVHPGGSGNVAIGKWAMFNPTSGDYNVAVGFDAFSLPNDGSNNVFIGYNSDRDNNSSTNCAVAIGAHSVVDVDSATAIGYRAYANQTNTLILGQVNGVNGATANTNVGIGTTTPSERLEVNGNIMINSRVSDGARLIWRGGSGGTQEYRARVFTDGRLSFFPIEIGQPGYLGEVLSLTQSGNVGIGNVNPSSKLEVNGEIKTSNDVNGYLTLGRCDNSSEGGQINFTGAGSHPSFWEDLSGDEFRIFTNSSTTVKVHMFNIGSGNTDLEIDGQAYKPGGGSWAVSSDRRSKENIVNYNKGLKELLQLRPVSFNYKKEFNWGNKTYVGLIAQEVEKVVPTMVEIKPTNGIEDFKVIDPNELTYMLINAVKELKQQNDEQQKIIDKLIKQNQEILNQLKGK